jgi:hypothetical protein
MKRTFFVLLATAMMMSLASVSHAWITRTKTMGNVDHFVYDDSNILFWPSTVVGFSDRFIFDLGEGVFTGGYNPSLIGPRFPAGITGGALFGLNDRNHLGLLVTANDRTNGGGITDPFFPGGLALDDFVTVFYGYGGGNVDFGASLNFGGSRTETTAPAASVAKQSVGRFGIQGGITYWMEQDNSFDLAFQFENTSITDEAADGQGNVQTIAENDGFNTVAIRARMFWNYTDDVQFVPFFELEKANRGVKWDTAADTDTDLETDKSETTTLDLALGVNHFPNEQVQLILVGGVRFMSTDMTSQGEDAGESNLHHIPYIKAGIDTELRDWLDIRAGVEKQLVGADTKGAGEGATEAETGSTAFQGYIGSGIHLGDWTIETQINPDIFFNGPNFISGNREALNHRVSLVRTW